MTNIGRKKAIRLKCIDCMCGQLNEIRACSCIECPLWKWRLGINPYTEKGLKNPYFQEENFKELENMTAFQVINKIKVKNG